MTSLCSIEVRSDSAVEAASHAVAHSETAAAALLPPRPSPPRGSPTAKSEPCSGAFAQSRQRPRRAARRSAGRKEEEEGPAPAVGVEEERRGGGMVLFFS